MKKINDDIILRKIEKEIEGIVKYTKEDYILSSNYLKKKKWLTIPLDDGLFRKCISLLAKKLESLETESCFVWSLAKPFECYEVEPTYDDILDASLEVTYYDFTIFPENRSFIIFYSVEDYFLIAGEKSFLESVMKRFVEKAFYKFKKYANLGADGNLKNFLLRVYERYKEINEEILKKVR